MSILGTLASGILASNALKIPAWESTAFGIFFLMLLAAWSAWSESRRKLEKLNAIIREANRVSSLQNGIAARLMKGGNLLIRSNRREINDEFTLECEEWDKEATAYLRSELNELAVAAFSHPAIDASDTSLHRPASITLSAKTKALKAIGLGIASFVRPLSQAPDKGASPPSRAW